MTGLGRRLRAVTTVALAGVVATAVATTAWAAPVAPTPVKDDPAVVEGSPAAAGPWFGWVRGGGGDPIASGTLVVQRDGQPRVRVNAPGTRSSGGGILARSVVYAQQRGAAKPQLFSYDLRTGRRSALPPAVNRATYRSRPTTIRGDVSASGPWVLFTRRARTTDGTADQVVLYHRVSRQLRVLRTSSTDAFGLRAGQVNGSWATYARTIVGGANTSEVVRVNLRTGGRTTVGASNDPDGDRSPTAVHDPAVGPDGTLYYWRFTQTSTGGPITGAHDLVRVPVGGPREVVATVTGGPEGPTRTSVDERAGGATRVYYELDGDIFRVDG